MTNNLIMYSRHIEKQLSSHFKNFKQILILQGPRQVGKTTILKRIFPEALYLLNDESRVRSILESYDSSTYKQLIGLHEYIIIDEVHLLSDPGRAAKIIYDQIPNTKLILTGSSSFRIKNQTSESLAGRKIEYNLFPLTFSEFLVQSNIEKDLNFNIFENLIDNNKTKLHLFDINEILKNILVFGFYPELLQTRERAEYLINLSDSVIFKDIIELNLIENRSTAKNLLKLLAYQTGNLIKYDELSTKLSIDSRTIKRYIDIFEQSFILFRIYPYSNQKRNEISRSPKIYFWDNGLRNALINDFSDINQRVDSGALFENFIISEINKIQVYQNRHVELNFWRNKQGYEVDLVFELLNKLYAVEVKTNKGYLSSSFTNLYPEAKTKVINSENFY